MIRQLWRLLQPVPKAGQSALAPAVYAEARGDGFALRAAAESGVEGVACVDDAARAAVLFCRIWRDHGLSWAQSQAKGLLAFVTYMQDDDGRFVNFIEDWEGVRNCHGRNSLSGGAWWTARAMLALAEGFGTFGDIEYRDRFLRGLPSLERPTNHFGARAVAALAALAYWAASGEQEFAERASAWADEIAARHIGDVLVDDGSTDEVHLWAHLQEMALVQVGLALERPDLVRVATASVEALFVPAVAQWFVAPTTLPYDVSCTVLALNAVADANGDGRYAELAELARAWFHGRNAVGRPMYDRLRGLVHDGIDDNRINLNAGAESNIEGAVALYEELDFTLYSTPSDGATDLRGCARRDQSTRSPYEGR